MSARMEGSFVNQTLLGALIAVGSIGVITLVVLIWRTVQMIGQATSGLQQAIAANTEAIRDMNKQVGSILEQLQGHLSAMPSIMKAIVRIGEAQTEVYQAQFAGMNGNSQVKQSRTPVRDVETANAEYEISQMMRSEGISRAEAMSRLNPANARGPWAGMFEGWGTEGVR